MTNLGRFTLLMIVAVLVIIVVYFAGRGSANLVSPAAR